ncbi:MAG: acetyl-CoA carboxylase carboxyl transferase subunit alpha [Flavobacteriales bacterium]|nr:acetyl-CoA carboxylase carboxyl transferase subunit alpha [Flavobacteriales bacterium]|tara:strand:- start:4865 stop:5821 length:957 start_codon:yes stop_codon:yes gene_type:complete
MNDIEYLDFEKPIEDLMLNLHQANQLGKEGIEVKQTISDLKKKLEIKKKEIYSNLTAWQRVQISRHPMRPYTLDYIENISEDFLELHGDRNVKDDKAMIGGWAKIDGKVFMLLGQQKGKNTKMRQYRNFGMANPEGYRKALRLMKMAEKFNRPIVTFIDTPGAYPGLEAEERGQGEAIARNLIEMIQLRVPVICIIIGEGASGGALGIGIGDKVFMLENTWYSVISPESCSSILWRSWDHKEKAANALKLTAQDMLKNKLIDGIISEPNGGAHRNVNFMFESIKKTILEITKELESKKTEERINQRIAKFGNMGSFKE